MFRSHCERSAAAFYICENETWRFQQGGRVAGKKPEKWLAAAAMRARRGAARRSKLREERPAAHLASMCTDRAPPPAPLMAGPAAAAGAASSSSFFASFFASFFVFAAAGFFSALAGFSFLATGAAASAAAFLFGGILGLRECRVILLGLRDPPPWPKSRNSLEAPTEEGPAANRRGTQEQECGGVVPSPSESRLADPYFVDL